MRFMTLINADEDSESGQHADRGTPPSRHPSAKGAHVKRKWGVTDGPFAETKELFAG